MKIPADIGELVPDMEHVAERLRESIARLRQVPGLPDGVRLETSELMLILGEFQGHKCKLAALLAAGRDVGAVEQPKAVFTRKDAAAGEREEDFFPEGGQA